MEQGDAETCFVSIVRQSFLESTPLQPAVIVLFDIDGTLLATGGAGRQAMLAALREEFAVPGPESLLFSGRTDRHLLTGLLELSGQTVSEANVNRLRSAYGERLKQVLPTTRGAVLPGVIELLDQLRQIPECLMGVLTGNVPETAELKLRHYGLWDYFQIHFNGDQHALRTDLAKHALKHVQSIYRDYCGSRICLIGDTPMDIEAAQAIGARCLATATGVYRAAELKEYGATRVVENLTDTQEVLRWLVG